MATKKHNKFESNNVEIKEENFDSDLAALQGKGETESNNCTLFVRGVPFEVKDDQFQTFFEDIGPIKLAFVVKDNKEENKEKGWNRGIGFVTFALKEDARKAIEELSQKDFMGRKLKIEYANKKPAKDEEPKKSVVKTHKFTNPKPKSDEIESDRTVFISNIPKSMAKARLVKFLSENSIKPESTFFVTGYARALYETVELAQLACSKLQNKTADGTVVHATILTNLLLKTKKSRLIVRNLTFKVKERELEKVFEKIGPVIETKIPKNNKNQLCGFGFIQFPEQEMADKAIETLNNTGIGGRKIAVDYCVAKSTFDKEDENQEEEIKEEENDDIKDEESDGVKEEENDELNPVKGTKGFKNSMYEDANEEDILDSSDDEGEEEGVKEEDNKKEETNNVNKSKNKKFEIAPECTLFVRNLLFESKDEDLYEKFSDFGKLHYARVVYDKDTGKSRGTGFVCFRNVKDALNCLELSKQLNWENETAKNVKGTKSVLVPDAPSEVTERFTLQGRLILVSSAVSKDQAIERSSKDKEKVDKRNYYLLREGVIFPQSDAGKKLNEKEIQKRQESYTNRKNQLKSNPSLYISKTRLVIKNLPLDVDDKKIKQLAHSAIDKFKFQVTSKLRQPLSTKEMEEGWDKKAVIIQAKIVRSKDRIDNQTKLARSLGYGFVEFTHHAHALACLRYLNCNPEVFPSKAKLAKSDELIRGHLLMVEFAIENKLILKRRDHRKNETIKRKLNEEQEDKPEEKEVKQDNKNRMFLNKKRQKKKMNRKN